MQIYYLGNYQLRFKGYRACYTNHNKGDRRLGSNGRDYEDFCSLGCDALRSGSCGPRVKKTRLLL
jgi:hypothetical protein